MLYIYIIIIYYVHLLGNWFHVYLNKSLNVDAVHLFTFGKRLFTSPGKLVFYSNFAYHHVVVHKLSFVILIFLLPCYLN